MTAYPFVTLWLNFSELMVMRPTARGGPRASRANFATPTREPADASGSTCTTAQAGYSQDVGQLRLAISRAAPGTMRSALPTGDDEDGSSED